MGEALAAYSGAALAPNERPVQGCGARLETDADPHWLSPQLHEPSLSPIPGQEVFARKSTRRWRCIKDEGTTPPPRRIAGTT